MSPAKCVRWLESQRTRRPAVVAPADGWIEAIDALACGLAIIDLGGGRIRKGDFIDHGAGLVIAAPVGQYVSRGDPLVHVHAATEEIARRVLPRLETAWRIAARPVAQQTHVRYRIDRDGARQA